MCRLAFVLSLFREVLLLEGWSAGRSAYTRWPTSGETWDDAVLLC